jgi:serine/threonine protein kinase
MKPCECLSGMDLPHNWHITSCIHRPPTSTGGHFSVGYEVINSEGKRGYLKALDFTAALSRPDIPRALQEMTTAYNFERDLLTRCSKHKADRVVTAIDDGSVDVPGQIGQFNKVYYLIFEMADGDIRTHMSALSQIDIAWILRSLHQSAVGLSQLHGLGIAHQDIKPSNILVFPSEGSKLADLGRASIRGTSTANDGFPAPGDTGYAPPEQFYNWHHKSDFSPRFVADLYLLGSLVFFFFQNCSATQAIIYMVTTQQARMFTRSDFLQDLPYFEQAFSDALESLRQVLLRVCPTFTDELIAIAGQLCSPDPRRRGDPRVLASVRPQYDLQPYVSRFDRLAKKSESGIA